PTSAVASWLERTVPGALTVTAKGCGFSSVTASATSDRPSALTSIEPAGASGVPADEPAVELAGAPAVEPAALPLQPARESASEAAQGNIRRHVVRSFMDIRSCGPTGRRKGRAASRGERALRRGVTRVTGVGAPAAAGARRGAQADVSGGPRAPRTPCTLA